MIMFLSSSHLFDSFGGQFPNEYEEDEESDVEKCRGAQISVLDEIVIHQDEVVDAVHDDGADVGECQVIFLFPGAELGECEEVTHDDGEEEVGGHGEKGACDGYA